MTDLERLAEEATNHGMTYGEYRGECHGAPAWETLPCCPECGYDVENIEEE